MWFPLWGHQCCILVVVPPFICTRNATLIISYHPVIQGNIRRFWQQGISRFQLPEAEPRAIGATNPAGLNRRMFPMNKRVVYYFTTMRLIGLEVVSCAWNFVTTPLANRMVRALATISLLLLFIFSFEYRQYVFHYCCAQTWIENAAFFYDVSNRNFIGIFFWRQNYACIMSILTQWANVD